MRQTGRAEMRFRVRSGSVCLTEAGESDSRGGGVDWAWLGGVCMGERLQRARAGGSCGNTEGANRAMGVESRGDG